jgi:predicted ABC-type transport system involved in lysophospholipase L1 biosynthesis ATPase subunit
MDDVLVRAEDLGRVFGEGEQTVAAVSGATFTLRAGAGIALIGPSGSGKSTFLHLLAGLDAPTSGAIEWPALGERAALRPALVRIAFQGPSLLPPLTVAENVALPLLLAGSTEQEAQREASEMMEMMALSELGEKLPEELSGGQVQRAGLARALVGHPRLVLADEPTGQQDRATGVMVIDRVLRRVRSIGAALVVATHDPAVAARLPTHWRMRDGELTEEGALRSR